MYWIGTSGWSYRHWRERFYPVSLPASRWLDFYADRLRSVEINATFYRLQRRETFARWAAAVPAGFRFAFKASRYLTHIRRLRDVADGLTRLLDTTTVLEDKRGPMLLQLPPAFPADPARLSAFLDTCPAGLEVAVEFRDTSWFTDATEEALRRGGAALVWSDYPGAETPAWDTAAFLYIRRHGAAGRFVGRYGSAALEALAATMASAGKPAYCYFNNDAGAAAVLDAIRLTELVAGSPA